MTGVSQIVVIGNGHAGVQVADSLRQQGYTGALTLIGDEDHAPYQRPPLSKEHLSTATSPDLAPLRGSDHYDRHGVTLHLGTRVSDIDRSRHEIRTGAGEVLRYSKLILATGTAGRKLDVPGRFLDGVVELRTLSDAHDLQHRLGPAKKVLIVGAGFIGLEVAAMARARGLDITVVEPNAAPLMRALSGITASHLARELQARGVAFRFGETVTAFEGRDGKVRAARTSTDERIDADLVLVSIGVTPRTELAVKAGLEVQNGIVVDATLTTSDPDILAIGDCANHPSVHIDGPVRIESVQNATDQARTAAKTALGRPSPYTATPWFWSDQGDTKLQIVGIASPDDESVLRGDVDSGKFSVFRFRNDRLTAVESVNRLSDHMAARRLLQAHRGINRALAANLDFDLKGYSKTGE
ncbi:NAD(P)/FAD-dependent oxidoreductase [Rhodococcus sp. IEGM1428]|uniref:NAD(P)/FAD-dependent oxidoreductase n=1 Tax=Rhodococcus sp. IEGM1428 TaxID=3392191 RepID=UPI003D0E871D